MSGLHPPYNLSVHTTPGSVLVRVRALNEANYHPTFLDFGHYRALGIYFARISGRCPSEYLGGSSTIARVAFGALARASELPLRPNYFDEAGTIVTVGSGIVPSEANNEFVRPCDIPFASIRQWQNRLDRIDPIAACSVFSEALGNGSAELALRPEGICIPDRAGLAVEGNPMTPAFRR